MDSAFTYIYIYIDLFCCLLHVFFEVPLPSDSGTDQTSPGRRRFVERSARDEPRRSVRFETLRASGVFGTALLHPELPEVPQRQQQQLPHSMSVHKFRWEWETTIFPDVTSFKISSICHICIIHTSYLSSSASLIITLALSLTTATARFPARDFSGPPGRWSERSCTKQMWSLADVETGGEWACFFWPP